MFLQYGQREMEYLKSRDPKMGLLIDHYGHLEREVIPDLFTAVVFAITGQQISTKAHRSIFSRLRELMEDSITPERMLAASENELRACGLSGRKVSYICGLAQQIVSGEFDISVIAAMSDEELEKYASLWSIKHAQAREQAVSELEGLRVETQNNIAQLREDADRELDEYRAVWQEQMEQVTIDANAELDQLRQDFGEKVGLIKKDTEAEMKEMSEVAQKILREAGWDETGQQIVTGLTEGVETQKPTFITALTAMATAGVAAVKSVLQINSPSRVTRKLGEYTGLGFVDGLHNYADKSYKAGSEMAESARFGLSNIIQTIADIVNSDMDMAPTIRPVLDLSNITNGAGVLDSLFYPQRTLGLAGQVSMAFAARGEQQTQTITINNDDVVEELRSLRADMTELTDRMERMRVVLDTGTLVGEMAGPMDNALGQRVTRRGRGN